MNDMNCSFCGESLYGTAHYNFQDVGCLCEDCGDTYACADSILYTHANHGACILSGQKNESFEDSSILFCGSSDTSSKPNLSVPAIRSKEPCIPSDSLPRSSGKRFLLLFRKIALGLLRIRLFCWLYRRSCFSFSPVNSPVLTSEEQG